MNPQILSTLNLAIQYFQSGNLVDADKLLVKILSLDQNNLPALQILGLIKATQKNYLDAIKLLKKAIKLNPNDASLNYNLATVLSDSGNDREALQFHERSTRLAPSNPNAWLNLSKCLSNIKNFSNAFQAIEIAINLDQKNPIAWNNKGAILKELGQIEGAIDSYNVALRLDPTFSEAAYNQGIAFSAENNLLKAIDSFDLAIQINSNHFSAINNKGVALMQLMRYEEALVIFEQSLKIKPDYLEALINKAVALMQLRKLNEALQLLSNLLEVSPNNASILVNKGIALLELNEYGKALDCLNEALIFDSNNIEALINKSTIFIQNKSFEEAVDTYKKILSINPRQEFILGMLLHAKMQICDWDTFDQDILELSEKIKAGEKVTPPFPLLALTSDEALHLQAAKIWTNTKHPTSTALPPIAKRERQGKIRLGYYSADFHEHATAYLTAELFECHNKELFELFAFSFGPNTQDQMQTRIAAAFDHFIDVRDKSDLEIAQLSRDLGIDIAVDLKGFTQHSRPGIFAHRAAPSQVSYLGYPGTMGADYIDYIIADKIVIPESSKIYYSERVIYLPHSYQVNDSKREISNLDASRSEFGLPENGFVFSCFNNNYKITSDTFKTWMEILQSVDNSVLWLFESNESAKKNLKKYANLYGINPSRIIFAKQLPLAEHLARHRLVDLFLDTLPYNAHTTASDALWAGAPVLTQIGNSFAGRVAASLNLATGLQDLIATTADEYKRLAIQLANNAGLLTSYRKKLLTEQKRQNLFDVTQFCNDIENVYQEII